MNINGRRIWQVAAGDGERSYQRILLEWDVIAIGPGEYKRWPECEPAVVMNRTQNQATIIRRFAEQMTEGDLVILRRGKSMVYAVGEVASSYMWFDDFGDIDGWDLQHIRRVRWLWMYKDAPMVFGDNTLRFGDSVQQAASPALEKWLRELEIPQSAYGRKLIELPESCRDGVERERISLEQLTEGLFDLGIGLSDANVVIDRLRELAMLSGWYQRANDKPAEAETIAYLVVPLLRSLGWTPQRMAVEWYNIDLALFSRLPRTDENLAAVLEGKAMTRACLIAKEQGEGYVQAAERRQCERLIVTEGTRYAVFLRDGNHFRNHPTGYISLTRRLPDYPILRSAGAVETIALLAADWTRSGTAITGK